MDDKKLTGKVAWVTGAGSGIGKAVALELGRRGAAVALSGRRRDRLDEVAGELTALGATALVVPLDVTDEHASDAAAKTIVAALGRLDIAIANAGFGASGTIMKLPADVWRKQLDVNVIGVVNTVRSAVPELEKSGGRLALVASVMGLMTTAGQGPYAASKFAVRAIGLTLSQELHGTGVSCTTIHPGFVESEIGQVDVNGVFDAARRDKRPAKFMWTADKAARTMVDAIMARRREFVFTKLGRVAGFLGKHFPGVVHFAMTRPRAKRQVAATIKAP